MSLETLTCEDSFMRNQPPFRLFEIISKTYDGQPVGRVGDEMVAVSLPVHLTQDTVKHVTIDGLSGQRITETCRSLADELKPEF